MDGGEFRFFAESSNSSFKTSDVSPRSSSSEATRLITFFNCQVENTGTSAHPAEAQSNKGKNRTFLYSIACCLHSSGTCSRDSR